MPKTICDILSVGYAPRKAPLEPFWSRWWMVVDVDAEESPRHFVCICIKNWLPDGDLSIEFRSNNNSNNNNFRLFSLSLPLESKEEGNLFARWWADEVQYYVSEQVSKLEPVPGLPSVTIALRQLLDILSTHITGIEARPDLLFFFYFFCFLLLLLLLLGIVPENSMV